MSVSTMVKEWERAVNYTKGYLDAMTEQGYALRPTVEMRSFAEQMLHVANVNYSFISWVTGEQVPYAFGELEKLTTDKSKANVTRLVLASYDAAISAIKKMTPAQLTEQVMLLGQFEMTKATAWDKGFEHQTHHRGQTAVYLRMANVTPPNAMLF